MFLAPSEVQAKASFVETIGVGAAAGAVLGASTIPFYTDGGAHLGNIAAGAAAGIVVGLGVWIYTKVTDSGSSSDDYSSRLQKYERNEVWSDRNRQELGSVSDSSQVVLWTPLVAMSW